MEENLKTEQITQRNCWLTHRCNHKDCNDFCMRFFKLDTLYNCALITYPQRRHIDLIPEGEDVQAFTKLKELSVNIEDFVSKGQNLYIHSQNCGNGKTAWSLRMVECYFDKIWIKSDLKCRALFINVPRFLLALKENISQKSEYVEHIKKNVLECDLVVWDEVGTKACTTFEAEQLLSLINARIDSNKSNIYTSNLNDEELHKVLGDRLYSRIVNMSLDIEFKGGDRREAKL